MRKRISSLFLAAVMVFTMLFTLLPVTAYADELIPVGASDFAGGDGTEYDPYLIETAEQLNNVRNFLGEEYRYTYFKLIATISLSAYPNWEPIGNEDNPFYGRFYSGSYNIGSDYQITDLTINRPDESYVGLFGCCGDAMFVNLTIEGANVTGGPKTGILAGALGHKITEEPGRVFYGRIEKCSSTGSVRSSTQPANGRVGGLVGELIKTTHINNSNSTASVTGAGSVGGVAGYVADGGTVQNCYSAGSVTGIVTGSYYAGGVAGYVDGGGTVQNCYATGSVTGARSVGGVVGFVNKNGEVRSCAATNSSVSGTNDVGGVAGTVEEGTVEYCYAACNVTGQYAVGGVVGYAFNCMLLCCYATGSVTGTGSVGGVVGSVDYVTVQCCAALNPSVSGRSNVDRVAGYGNNVTFRYNCAFSGVTVTVDGTVTPITGGAADNINGANKTAAEIKADGTLGGLFTEYFTTENGKLPGFGAAVDMPAYIVDTITITTTSLPGGTVGIAYSQTLAATGGMPITWTIDSGSLPNGLSLSGNTISGTPTTAGNFGFTVKAENAEGSDTMAFEIVISSPPPVGTAPTITTTSLPDGTVSIAYSQTLAATGDTPIAWTIDSGSLPDGLSLSGNTISGTPTTAGNFGFTIKAENAEGSDTKALEIVIGSAPPVGTAPAITTTSLPGGTVGTAYSQTLAADGDTPITWSIDSGDLPGGLTLSSAGVISGTPTTAGTFDFTVKATNDEGSDTKALEIVISSATVTGAEISPATGGFDRYSPGDVTTSITWNSATAVTGISDGTVSLASPAHYGVSGNTLTIKEAYLETRAVGSVVLTIAFDQGDPATLTVFVTDSTPPSISPASASYDLTAPDDVITTITWNSASTVTDVVYDANSLATGTDYTVTGSALTIKDSYLSGLGPSEGDTLVFGISFNTGDTAALTVYVVNSYTPSGDADLSDLTVGGSTVSGFDPADDEYDVELPYGTQPGSAAATVGGAANDPLAQVSVTQASALPGSATVTVTAEDGTIKTYTVNFTLGAAPGTAPAIITASLPGGTVGTPYSQTLAATGDTPITWTIDSGDLPNGLSLSGNTISGTPTTAGTFDFTVKAENAEGDDTKVLEIVIGSTPPVGTAPTITTTSLPGGTVSTPYSQTLAATGDTPIAWTIDSGSLPNGLSLSSNTISGTPTTAGTFGFTVKAENAEGSDTKALEIVIGSTPPVGTAPTITTTSLPDGRVGSSYSRSLAATGDTPITWTIDGGSLPNGLTLSSTGVISGTPTARGNFSFTVKATNAVGSVTKELSITINAASTGGGSSDGGSDSGTTVIIQPEKKPDQPVMAGFSVAPTVNSSGHAIVTVSQKSVADAIAKAQADAKAQGKTANGIAISLNIDLPDTAKSLGIVLPQTTLKSLVDAGVKQLEINGVIISLDFDLEALKEIQNQSTGDVTITIKPVKNLSEATKKLIGARPVYDVTVSYVKDGKTVNITSLGKGSAILSFPYTPGKNEAVGWLFGVYVDGKGNATRISGSAYDANSGSIILSGNHFSIYGVGYTAPTEKYTDIATHWARESIDYAVGRGLFSGTTDTAFSPNMAMDRGMLVTVLGRLAGADVSAYKTSSFTDVAAGKYYLPYVEWAYKKGIISGIGNGNFAPERAVTREEIALILQNYAKATGYTLPVTREAITFADNSSIGSNYAKAVRAMQQAGIMVGGSGNKFNPKAGATRAEVAAMLHRYVKLTIDPATAQGWAKNDDGRYMYYKDGKPLTGWQTIDGTRYFFHTNGTLQTGWVKDGDNWRFYSGNRALVGWWDIGSETYKKRYYFDVNAVMVSGKWLQIDGKWYYFYTDGSLARSTTIDGYEVDENGVRKTE